MRVLIGCEESQRVCLALLWLKNLPPLIRTVCGLPDASWCKIERSPKMLSKTFPGIAKAMANQWGGLPPLSGQIESLVGNLPTGSKNPK